MLRIPAARFKRIKAYAKKQDATINDMLVTAYYRAMFSLVEPNQGVPMTNTVTINLRRNLTKSKPKAMCNLSVGVFTEIPYQPGESFEQTLAFARDQMNEKKKQNPGIGIAFTLETAMKIMNFKMLKKYTENLTKNDYKKRKTHPIFTNIGIIKGDHFSFHNTKVTDAYFVTPIMNAPGMILGTSTFENILTVTFGFYDGSYEKNLVDKFLNCMKDELPK